MTDVPLLRNKSGTARDRDAQTTVEDLEFEAAIGRNVRQLRQQHGLTVAEMAAKVGISKAMMSKIENAQTSCSLSTLALLAKGFDIPVTSLFRGADMERPAAFVKAGTGARIVRNGTKDGHEYELLGSLRGEHKRLECLHVTLSEKSRYLSAVPAPGHRVHLHARGRHGLRPQPFGVPAAPGRLPADRRRGRPRAGRPGPVPIRFLSVIAFPDSQV